MQPICRIAPLYTLFIYVTLAQGVRGASGGTGRREPVLRASLQLGQVGGVSHGQSHARRDLVPQPRDHPQQRLYAGAPAQPGDCSGSSRGLSQTGVH